MENCIKLSIKLGEQTLLMAVFDALDLKKNMFFTAKLAHPVRKWKWKAEKRASSNFTSQGF